MLRSITKARPMPLSITKARPMLGVPPNWPCPPSPPGLACLETPGSSCSPSVTHTLGAPAGPPWDSQPHAFPGQGTRSSSS